MLLLITILLDMRKPHNCTLRFQISSGFISWACIEGFARPDLKNRAVGYSPGGFTVTPQTFHSQGLPATQSKAIESKAMQRKEKQNNTKQSEAKQSNAA